MFERILFYIVGVLFLVYLVFLRTCIHPTDVNAHYQAPDDLTKAELGEYNIPKSKYHRGMVVGIFPYQDEKPVYRKTFDELYAHGVNTVSLNFNWYMNTIYDPTVYKGTADEDNQTASDKILMSAVDDAHAAGLRVMLFPSIYVMNLSDREWRGRIKPTDWDIWFKSYRNLTVELAKVAQKHKVEFYCIGIELLSTEKYTEKWRGIIKDIREVYDGLLCYSENWDARNKNTEWFHDLDMLAMNAYYKLADEGEGNPLIEDLVKSWYKHKKDIEDWKKAYKKPLIITEIGYCSVEDALAQPWDYLSYNPLDMEEQRLGYEAFFRSWYDDSLFDGVYFYHWQGEGGIFDNTYTPRGKPAAEVLKTWFKMIAAREAKNDALNDSDNTIKPESETNDEKTDAKDLSAKANDDITDENHPDDDESSEK